MLFRSVIPFHSVYLTGTARDAQHRRMSKSLGNGIDPLDVVNLYGADALRWTVIAGMGIGADLLLDHENIEQSFSTGRNFATKLWNIGRFLLLQVGGDPVRPVSALTAGDLKPADHWILSRLDAAVRAADAALGPARPSNGKAWTEAERRLGLRLGQMHDDLDGLARGRRRGRAGMQHAAAVAQAGHAFPVEQVRVDAGHLRGDVGAHAEHPSGELVHHLEGAQLQVVPGAGEERIGELGQRRHHQFVAAREEQVEQPPAQALDAHRGKGRRAPPGSVLKSFQPVAMLVHGRQAPAVFLRQAELGAQPAHVIALNQDGSDRLRLSLQF